jgi:integrase
LTGLKLRKEQIVNYPKRKAHSMTSRGVSQCCEEARIDGLVWHDLRATYGTRLGDAGFNAYDIAKLMGHANISTNQRYVRNLPVGVGEVIMLKNQRRHSSTVPRSQRGFGRFDGGGK